MFKRTAAMVAILMMAASPVMAGDQDFTLKNRTGYTIDQVYVSAAKTDDWEEDVMGKDTLGDGESVDITFGASEGACKFDLKVVYDDKEEAIWEGLNLCSISTVSISYNRKTGETSATTD